MTHPRHAAPLALVAGVLLASCTSTPEREDGPRFKADVPHSVRTPDVVSTRLLGALRFMDGMPDTETVRKTYDFLDVSRAAEAFLDGIPAASVYGLLEGFRKAGVKPGELGIFEQLMDARSLFLTPNSTTMYCMAEIDVEAGPVVVEVPPGVLGPVDDAYFRWVTDVGVTGRDKGQGGTYVFAHASYEGPLPNDAFEARTPTYRNLFFFRAFVKDGDLEGTARAMKAAFRMYPLDRAEDPPEQVFHNLSGVRFNTVHANDVTFFDELNAVIQREPADAFDPELVGLFASIGIKKGQPFEPDERMQRILAEGVAIGNATARALTFSPRKESAFFWEGRQWCSPFAGQSYQFLHEGERVLDDRIFFHYLATGITPAMAAPKVGSGSVYAFSAKDSEGRYLDGSRTYTVRLPHPIPYNNFWSFMVYSGQHRSMLETDQRLAGLDSNNPALKPDEDGSYTVWFGPKPPKGHEGNWIQTWPGKSFNCLLRIYGPLEPWFDGSWVPGDFERVE